MLKKIARLAAQTAMTVLMLAVAYHLAPATVIEGYTPSGNFKSVGVTEDGQLQVQNSTSVAVHVTVDTGAITITLPTGPGGSPIPLVVTTPAGQQVEVKASTVATVTNACGSSNASASLAYPSDINRTQGVLCNEDTFNYIWLGGSGVTVGPPADVGNGLALPPGGCLSPDMPASFVGQLFVISTDTAKYCYIYFGKP
jgi:hypothetical protein